MKQIIFATCVLISLVACRKEATSWSTDWVAPIINDSLDLRELTNDSTLSVNNNYYEVALTRTLEQIKPADYLDIPDTVIHKDFVVPVLSLSVPPGVSFVTDVDDHIFNLDDVLLRKARMKSGELKLTVTNPINTTCFFDVELPATVKNGQPFIQSIEVGANKTTTLQVDIAGYEMDLRGTSGLKFNALRTRLKVYTDPNGAPITISSQDTTKIDIELKNMEVDYAQGYFGQYSAADTYTIESDLINEKISGTIDLPALRLEFIMKNGLKALAQANIKSVSNTNTQTGVTVPLISSELGNPFLIQHATGSWSGLLPSEKSLVFDESNSNIEPFIENLGGTFKLAYEVKLNPFGNITSAFDEFFPHSELDLLVKLNMPLSIGLNDFQLKDTFAVNFSQDLEQSHVDNGILHLKLENGFPLEGHFELYFLDDFGQTVLTLNTIGDIPSSLTGMLNSKGIPTVKTQLDIPLNAEQLASLELASKMAIVAKFNTPDPLTGNSTMVAIPEHAFLWVKAQISAEIEQIIPE